MQTAKIEQTRFVDYTDLYFQSSEETSVAGGDILSAQTSEKTAKMQAAAPTPQSKANKTITSRRTVFGKSTVSKPAFKKLKSGAN